LDFGPHRLKQMEDVDEIAPDEPAIPIREHTAIIREIHHRLRNNLQMLISLVGVQAGRTIHPELAGILRETQNRIRAVSSLYDPLYSVEDFSTIHFGEYLLTLARQLENLYDLGPRVHLEVSTADMALDGDIAAPLALISNELISNAFKHGFSGDRSGNIEVTLQYAARQMQDEKAQFGELKITDDGVGLPAGVDLATAESMGLYLVRVLTHQLKGTLEASIDPGTSIHIRFPFGEISS
jgi:two-component sensor histidine kinase